MPTKRTSKAPLSKEETLLGRLKEALSEEELGRVLACSLLVMDEAAVVRLVERLGSETGATLLTILRPTPERTRGAKSSGPVVSKGKLHMERTFDVWRGAQEVP